MTKTLAKNTRHTSDRLKTSYYIDGNGRHVWMFQCGIMIRAKLWQQASRSKCRLLEDYDKALGMIEEATPEAESAEKTISITWSTDDVAIYALDNMGITLLFKECALILDGIKWQHDCTVGITWDTIEAGIENFIDSKEGVVI